MARRKKGGPPLWRSGFLRALGASGNARAAARSAGVDASGAYAYARRHPAFARAWAKAAAIGRARAEAERLGQKRAQGPRHDPGSGTDLILRHSARGTQLVRAAAGRGRWSTRREAAFLRALGESACVRWAAAEAGISTTALYVRRFNYPAFAADWDREIESARARLHEYVVGAGIAAFDAEAAARAAAAAGAEPPKVSIDQAIAILRLKGAGGSGAAAAARTGSALRHGPPEPSAEQVRENILARLDAIEAHERRAKSGA